MSQTGNSYDLYLSNDNYSYSIKFHLEQFHGSPFYSINNRNLCIDIPYSSMADGIQVQQFTCNQQNNQRWFNLSFDGSGLTVLVNENSGKCLDVRPSWNGDFKADGDVIQQFTCHFGPNQQWMQLPWVIPFTQNAGVAIVNKNSSKCIDVPSASTVPNTLLQQFTCNLNANQLWWW
jgi:endoglucanase